MRQSVSLVMWLRPPCMQARKCLITLKAGFGPNLVDKTLDVQRLLFNFAILVDEQILTDDSMIYNFLDAMEQWGNRYDFS